MLNLTYTQIECMAKIAAAKIKEIMPTDKGLLIYGVPRGGVAAAYAIKNYLSEEVKFTNNPYEATLFIDDLVDSGDTRTAFSDTHPNIPFIVLLDKKKDKIKDWVIFPWEETMVKSAEDIPLRLLQYVGEDPKRGGLLETPDRYLRAWKHFTSGYKADPKAILKVFEDGADKCDEMVLVKNIPVYSQCEHHLVPFFGVAHVAYLPAGKIVGLSKLSRVVNIFARRLQVQERLTNQIADALDTNLHPKGVAVVIECRHLCMESRGISQQGHTTITSAMRGAFLNKPEARAEFMGLIK